MCLTWPPIWANRSASWPPSDQAANVALCALRMPAQDRLPHGAMSALAFGASPSRNRVIISPCPALGTRPDEEVLPNPSSKSRRYQGRPSRFQALTNEGETIEPLKWDCQQRYQVKEPER
jgi:hypothetical protein